MGPSGITCISTVVGTTFLSQIGCHGDVSYYPGGIDVLPQELPHVPVWPEIVPAGALHVKVWPASMAR